MSWTIDDETRLFNLICDFAPLGDVKDKNLKIIEQKLNENGKFKVSDIVEKLGTLYNLKWFEPTEESQAEEEESPTDEEDSEDIKSELAAPEEDTTYVKEGPDTDNQNIKIEEHTKDGDDTSDLSDVDNEEEVDLESRRITRNVKKQITKQTSTTPAPTPSKKRTRAAAKIEETPKPPEKKQRIKLQPPADAKVPKRRLRSDIVEDEEQEKPESDDKEKEKEKDKTIRKAPKKPVQQPVRRSTRRK